ncbi:OmpA family protein [Pararhodonellum marinum]|uniref:OmpA family protein n=1 Tax=Pararhodonellum marinum TaxID=2755358 RepID=UPI00188F5307|nr:OmpA family protein [Pararhodonellum marinum]
MKRIILITLISAGMLGSCVSKKKYVELENNLHSTELQLAQTTQEKTELEEKMAAIERRVTEYNARINSLKDSNDDLQKSNDEKLSLEGVALMSKNTKAQMRETLAKMDPEVVAQAKTLEDSINLAVGYNLKSSITDNDGGEEDDITIDIDKTVVMISVSDKLLFNTASYRVNSKAHGLLKRLAEVINSEPSLEVMIEGHTDPRSISNAVVQDNWDLSVKRATSIVRILQEQYGVAPEKLIAAGRASYMPLVDNDNPDNMAKNRRTRIVIIPDLDKFFSLM